MTKAGPFAWVDIEASPGGGCIATGAMKEQRVHSHSAITTSGSDRTPSEAEGLTHYT